MDVLRKELNSIYSSQHLENERLDVSVIEACKKKIATVVSVTNACSIITDAYADTCYIYAGSFARMLGIADDDTFYKELNSSDEDLIYTRMHPEDLVEKRMLEYEFFKYVDKLPAGEKLKYVATCRIRIQNFKKEYIYIKNTTQILHESPNGKIWLILCCYDLSSDQNVSSDISSGIINNETGEVIPLSLKERRGYILTEREKEILRLVADGKPSKQIASLLGISINTVNRHRQNILEKLSVGNSLEAIKAVTAMKLL